MTNFEEQYQITLVEKTPECVAARKEIYAVKNRAKLSREVLALYRDRVIPQWLDLILRFPDFRRIPQIQEDSYDLEIEYCRLLQFYNREFFEGLATGMVMSIPTSVTPGTFIPLVGDKGQMHSVWPEQITKQIVEKANVKILYIRDFWGPYDQMFLIDSDKVQPLTKLAPELARAVLWPPLPPASVPDFAFARFVGPPSKAGVKPEIGLGNQLDWIKTKQNPEAAKGTYMLLSSAEERRILTRIVIERQPPEGLNWQPVVGDQAMYQMRQVIPWLRARVGSRPDNAPGGN